MSGRENYGNAMDDAVGHPSAGIRFRLYPEEILGILFFILLIVLSWKYGGAAGGSDVVLGTAIGAFLLTFMLAAISGIKGFTVLKVARNWIPIPILLMVYGNLGGMIHCINPNDADPALKRIDDIIFLGTNPTLWMEQWIRPWFSEIMHYCYPLYYPFLFVLPMMLYLSGEYRFFRNLLVSVMIGFYIGYIGYLLFPAIGPRYYMAPLFTVDVKGLTMLSERVYQTLSAVEPTRHGAFPSLHLAATAINTTYAWKYMRRLFWFLLPVNISILMAILYLRHHYMVDVIAGLVLAAFCVWVGPKVNAFWYAHVTGDHVSEDYPEKPDPVGWIKRLFRGNSGRRQEETERDVGREAG